jgi:hypothetical protein
MSERGSGAVPRPLSFRYFSSFKPFAMTHLHSRTLRLSMLALAGMHFQKPKYLDFTVDASQTYFIKYDEENKISRSEHTGPFMIMPDKVARQEIVFTRLKSSVDEA